LKEAHAGDDVANRDLSGSLTVMLFLNELP